MSKEVTYTLKLDAEMSSLLNKLKTAKSSLSGLMESGKAPKGLTKAFDQIETIIGRIQDKSSKPLVSLSEFNALSKDLASLQTSFGGLIRNIEGLKDVSDDIKIELFPKKERDKLKATIEATEQYKQKLLEIKKLKSLSEKANRTEATAEGGVERAKKGLETTKKTKVTNTEKLNEKKVQYAAIEDKTSDKAQKLAGSIKQLTKTIAENEEKIIEQEAALKKAETEYTTASGTAKTLRDNLSTLETNSMTELAAVAQKLGITFEQLENETPEEAIARLGKEVDNLLKKGLNKLPSTVNKISGEFNELKNETIKTSRVIGSATDEFKQLQETSRQSEAFDAKVKQFVGITGAAQVMHRALRDAMQTITELDATMTEMAVVTDLGVGDYWDQLPEYSKQASDLGVSINSAYKAATLYYQQGLKTNEVTAISAETLKMARIAGLSAEDSTNKMTAALRGFNMELNETSAKRVADVYSELAAITAADTKEISNAMTKTASIASSAGMEFETTAAFLSQIIETTRESAETAGTAMKTIIARFQELKKDPSEIGEIEGEVVDANKIETALRSVGVALRDSSGQFRELDDVFLELSSKWDGLDKNTQRYIATIAAGSRQQSRFIAMMSDYNRTQELVTAANTSAGASQKQFEKTTESLESKIAKLHNAWHEFTMGIMNSDFVKAGVDILTKLMEIINKATKGFEGFTGSISKIGAVLGIFKTGQLLVQKFGQQIKAFFQEMSTTAFGNGLDIGKKIGEGVKTGIKEAIQEANGVTQEGAEQVANAEVQGTVPQAKTFKERSDNIAKQRANLALEKEKGQVAFKNASDEYWKRENQKEDGQSISYSNRQVGWAKGQVTKAQNNLASIDAQEKGLDEQQAALEAERKKYIDNRPQVQHKGVLNLIPGASPFANGVDSFKRANQLKKDNEPLFKDYKQKKDDYVQADTNYIEAQKQATKAQNKLKKLENSGDEKKIAKAKEEEAKATKELAKAEDELVTSTENYNKAKNAIGKNGEEIYKAQSDGLKQIGNGLANMGAAASMAGIGIAAVGQAFTDAGFEKEGEAIATVGTIFSTLGATMSILGPIISGLSTAFGAAGTAGVGSGVASTAAWSVVGLIVMAVMAAILVSIALIIGIMALINKNSAEQKLKKTEEAAEKAGEAADAATESFNNLNDALNNLDEQQKTLEGLRQGTEEWNKAVQDVNQSVLDLVDKYPELAAFVDNKNGVLSIDVDSDEVQKVLNDYKAREVAAKNVELSAKQNVAKAKSQVEFSELDAVKDVGDIRASQAFSDAVGAGTAAGAYMGAAASPIGMGIGAVTGAITGAIVGGFTQADAKVKTGTDEELKDATDALAKAVLNNEVDANATDMQAYLEEQGVLTDEARALAQAFATDKEALLEYGNSVKAMEMQNKAYYTAMRMNAQSMIDMSKYSAEQQRQMMVGVDNDRLKELEDQRLKELEELDTSGSDSQTDEEYKKMQEEYARSIYGDDATVKDGKITYKDAEGNEKTQVLTEEEWKNNIANWQATQDATKAMEMIPQAIINVTNAFDKLGTDATETGEKLSNSFKRAFSQENGMGMLLGDIKNLTKGGNTIDVDILKTAWEGMSEKEQEELYDGDIKKLEKDLNDMIDKANKAFAKAKSSADNMGFAIDGAFSKMNAEAAEGFTKNLEKVWAGKANNDTSIDGMEEAINRISGELSTEDFNSFMSQVNALDWSDVDAWKSLDQKMIDLGVSIPNDAMQEFITKSIEASGAIRQIDYSNLSSQVKETIDFLKAVNTGEQKRTVDEDTYNKLIDTNSRLSQDFVKLGDEYVYLGTSIYDLTDAMQENTAATLKDAAKQLNDKVAISELISGDNPELNKTVDNISGMSEMELIDYLNSVRAGVIDNTEADLSSFGIAGLSNTTNFASSVFTKEDLQKFATEIASTLDQADNLRLSLEDKQRQADVVNFSREDSMTNASLALTDEKRSEALMLQAVQSGTVSEQLMKSYQEALAKANEQGATEDDKKLAQDLANKIGQQVAINMEENQSRDEYSTLLERISEAIYDLRQKEIDKLSEVNDTISETNNNLISKIQEQIDEERQRRENEEAEKNLTDLQQKATYLGMDTSGSMALDAKATEKELEQAQQDYQDSLIDQALTDLQDANERAAEQRQEQIDILQTQLDYDKENGNIIQEAKKVLDNSLSAIQGGAAAIATEMGTILGKADSIKQLSEIGKQGWGDQLQKSAVTAENYYREQLGLEPTWKGKDEKDMNAEELAAKKSENEAKAAAAISQGTAAAKGKITGNNRSNQATSYTNARNSYIKAQQDLGSKKTETELGAEFDQKIEKEASKFDTGSIDGLTVERQVTGRSDYGRYKFWNGNDPIGHAEIRYSKGGEKNKYDESVKSVIGEDREPKDGWLILLNGTPYIFSTNTTDSTGKWWPAYDYENGFTSKFKETLRNKAAFKTGGLAEFTGPAWLDGTPSKPEYVLNAAQTERFFALIDVLERFDTDKKSSRETGDLTIDVDINVESISSDYDLEKIADKIRNMIYDDAMYRNVRNIN